MLNTQALLLGTPSINLPHCEYNGSEALHESSYGLFLSLIPSSAFAKGLLSCPPC
jgi:hypothetical protein